LRNKDSEPKLEVSMSDSKIKPDGEYPFDLPNKGWHRVFFISIELAARMLGVKHFGPNNNHFMSESFVVVGIDTSSRKVLAVYRHAGLFELIINERKEAFDAFRDKYDRAEVYPSLWSEVFGSSCRCKKCLVIWRAGQPCPGCGEKMPDDEVVVRCF
jgi:hypothetical protein